MIDSKFHQVSNTQEFNKYENINNEVFLNKDIFPDLHLLDGPLKVYRSKATFDWRKMRLIFDTLQSWELKFKIWNFIKNNEIFDQSIETLPIDEQRKISNQRMFAVINAKLLTIEEYLRNPELSPKFFSAFGVYDANITGKVLIAFYMFPKVIQSLGNKSVKNLVMETQELKNIGCFALIEFAHGSNTQGMKTTATYEPLTKSFVLNTPNFEAAKCWIGNLGKSATHAIVYAQLYTNDGKCHGLNAFVVPLRDSKTHLTFPGVTIGDMGEKISINGIDNGFLIFNNYKIPKSNLLSKTGDIDDDGNFITQFKDPKKRMGLSFAMLSEGRVGICEFTTSYGVSAISIAIRYSASRKQFGPDDTNIEFPVIEYQSQQYRLIRHLANIFAIKFFSNWIAKECAKIVIKGFSGEKISTESGMEMHAISSAGKPVCGWITRDCIQDCREACGGHGYLKCARLGDLRNYNDPNLTYEGENNVLIQQASNFLISIREKGWNAFENASPLETAAFLKDGEEILKSKWKWTKVECAMKPENQLQTLNFIVAFLLEKTFKLRNLLKSLGQSTFDARNNSQVFHANLLAVAYAHRQIYVTFLAEVQKLPDSSPEQEILTKLLSMFGANLISTFYMNVLYESGFVTSINACELLQTGILQLLPIIKDQSIALVDAIAPPDYILNSPLGMSDGEVYKHLENFIYQSPDTFTRPSWWRDIVYKEKYLGLSKL
ncbi:hypothetical protein PVAND_016762 [Polypedilum vanderplanki]|uniref:Acyl-coenzyme A oxidase n=1 Tax=Polypedilum vanderplanki TaxID=319348 RepID=A0A9J6BGR3_POLVA|nr:hypothetical protein PVAND_016762 [Polypedilum vanderplanki]